MRQIGANSGKWRENLQCFRRKTCRKIVFCACMRDRLPAYCCSAVLRSSDCEAAALPGRFLPELGRSSERPFFCPVFCVLAASRHRSWALSPHRSPLLVRPQNLWAKCARSDRPKCWRNSDSAKLLRGLRASRAARDESGMRRQPRQGRDQLALQHLEAGPPRRSSLRPDRGAIDFDLQRMTARARAAIEHAWYSRRHRARCAPR